jgi:hypothetical protein
VRTFQTKPVTSTPVVRALKRSYPDSIIVAASSWSVETDLPEGAETETLAMLHGRAVERGGPRRFIGPTLAPGSSKG